MDTSDRLMKFLQATPEKVAAIDRILDGRSESAVPMDRRLLTITEAARELYVSRMTVHRMLADGRLPFVETRAGRRRIPSAALTEFAAGRGATA